MKINMHIHLDVRQEKRIDSLKFRRRRLQHKKHSLLSKLAHITPVTSIDSHLSHPQITPSTSINTSGEVSLPVACTSLNKKNGIVDRLTNRSGLTEGADISLHTPNLVMTAGNNVLISGYGGKGESPNNQSILTEGGDMSLHTPNRIVVSEGVNMCRYRPQQRNIESRQSNTRDLKIDTNTPSNESPHRRQNIEPRLSNKSRDLTIDTDAPNTKGVDRVPYRPQRKNVESCQSIEAKDLTLDVDRRNKKETMTNIFELNRCLDDDSDDGSTSSTVSSHFPLNYPPFKLNNVPPQVSADEKLQIPVAQLDSVAYAHGGYASAAPLMLQNPRWMLILQHLMPDAHEDLMSLLNEPDHSISERDLNSNSNEQHSHGRIKSTDDPLRVMKWAENNPVVTAFGVANSKHAERSKVKRKKREGSCGSAGPAGLNDMANFMSKRPLGQKYERTRQSLDKTVEDVSPEVPPQCVPPQRVPSIEWDVFLDPLLVKCVEQAMQRVDALSQSDYEASIAADIEVDRQVSRLISRMLLAHGSTAQLLAEALGMARGYNFSRVVKASEAVRRDLGRKDWSSFAFSCGRNEDSTMDETYTVPSKSVSFNGEASKVSPPKRSNSGRSKSSNTDGRTGGVFVERWLALFASALRLGMLKEKAVRDVIYGRKPKRRSAKSNSDTLHTLSARYLRGSEHGLDCTETHGREEEGDITEIDMLLRTSISSEDNMFIPTPSCSLFLCFGMDDPGATSADHGKSVMAECVKMISQILGEQLRLVLDLKSRNVPPRVWGRLIDNLRAKGLIIEAIGSFDSDELRMIGKHTSSPITLAIFFHSAGDLQRACHANEIRRGDTVYFNAGSLLWKKPSVCEATGMNCCQEADLTMALSQSFSGELHDRKRGGVKFEPYAFLKDEIQRTGFTECKATLADYQKRFDLNIGLYVQEFAIGSDELNSLVKLVNDRPSIYNLGLAWGGLNGYGTKSVQGDGFWKQRYVGRNWDTSAGPTKQMKLLAPEDHHLVQKVILAGQCGQVTTAHRLLDGIFDDDLAQNSICESPALQRLS